MKYKLRLFSSGTKLIASQQLTAHAINFGHQMVVEYVLRISKNMGENWKEHNLTAVK